MILPQDTDAGTPNGDGDATLITSGAVVRLRLPEDRPWNAVETAGKVPGGGATRGIIRGRSKASRRRFQQEMGRVDLSCVKGVMLLTLTWAAGAVPGHPDQQRFCDNYLKWVDRRFNGAPVAWAKERGTKKGRWHFHLVIFASDYVTCEAYQRAWNRIAGDYAGNVDVAFKKDSGVVRYLAKYLSKEVGVWQDDDSIDAAGVPAQAGVAASGAVDLGTAHIPPREGHTGRTWGWRFYQKLALAPVKMLKIPVRVAHQVRRTLARHQVADLRHRMTVWRDWARATDPNLWGIDTGIILPGWVDGAARKAKLHPWVYCTSHFEQAKRDYLRIRRQGSHLARGSFDRHGWSFFVAGDGSALTEGLSAYFGAFA
jgi:hypothetical protein